MRRVIVLLVVVGWLSGCTLEGEAPEISCNIGFETSLLESPPADTVVFVVESVDARFNKTFVGVRRTPQFGNPIEGNYTNTFVYQKKPERDNQFLVGLGTTMIDNDTTQLTIAFNFLETNVSEQVCRPEKVLQSDHEWSQQSTNKQGVEIILTIKIDDEWMTLSTNGQQADGLIFDLDGAELLDDFKVYGRLQGTYSGEMNQINPPSTTPMRVSISGSFIYNTQLGYAL